MLIQKILAYDVYNNTTGTERYQHVIALLNQSIDPISLHPDTLDCNQQAVLTSPRKRALTCINKNSALSVTTYSELNEIAFSLQDFCTENDFLENGSTAVRAAFAHAFMEDKLSISHKQLQTELINILALSKEAVPPLCVSHTFRMKLLEIYKKIGDELFSDPRIIKEHIDYKTHLYKFSEIIEV